jgi:hypothetical protein
VLDKVHHSYGGTDVQDILIRIETDDFAAWEEQHYLHAGNRASYGIQDGPAYRDLENPNAALFHIRVEDMDRAMGWFQSDTFKAATKLAKVTGRTFYEAHPRS